MKWMCAVGLLGLLPSVPTAWGNVCVDGARGEFLDCRANCREDFQAAKDACFNRDHDCVERCRAEREICRENSGFDADLARCRASRDAAVQLCKDQKPQGTDRDQCIDQAQVVAFQIGRASCRERVYVLV